jgi:hypothetical protein
MVYLEEGNGSGEFALTLHRDPMPSQSKSQGKGQGKVTRVVVGHAITVETTGSVPCPARALGKMTLCITTV